MENMGLAALLVIILTPIATTLIHRSLFFLPIGFITVSGMFIAILNNAMAARDELDKYKDS